MLRFVLVFALIMLLLLAWPVLLWRLCLLWQTVMEREGVPHDEVFYWMDNCMLNQHAWENVFEETLFKLTLDYEAEEVSSIQLLYFGTIPPTNSLCILKNGHIFAAS